MKKQIFKILTLTVIFFLYSCEKEDENHLKQETELESGMVSKMITSKDLESNTSIRNKLKDIFLKKDQFQSKDPNENTYSIRTDSIRLIENDGVQTYTFEIERSGNKIKNQLENLIIKQYSNDSTSAYILKYNFIGEGLSNLKSGLSIQDLVDKIEVQFLDTPPSNLVAKGPYVQIGISYQGGCWVVNGSPYQNQDGDIVVDIVPCPLCSCNNSSSGGAQNLPQYLYLADWGLTGGGGGSSGGGTGSPGGSGNPSGGGSDVSVPAVTFPLILQVNPIHSLNKITNRTEVKTKILQLKADVTTLAMEQGTEFFTETNSSSPLIQEDLTPNPQGIQFGPVFPNSILRIHSHDYPALEPVFSADDIYKMASFYKQKRQFQAPDAEDISSILVSNLGIFALRVTDPAKAKTFGDKLFNSAFLKLFNVNYDKRIRIEAYNNCNCILPNILYEKYLSNNLIDFLIKQDSGLTLYKAIVNVDGSLSWSILEKMN